jgi:hypothetical protein
VVFIWFSKCLTSTREVLSAAQGSEITQFHDTWTALGYIIGSRFMWHNDFPPVIASLEMGTLGPVLGSCPSWVKERILASRLPWKNDLLCLFSREFVMNSFHCLLLCASHCFRVSFLSSLCNGLENVVLCSSFGGSLGKLSIGYSNLFQANPMCSQP